jgi:hypothetical protein
MVTAYGATQSESGPPETRDVLLGGEVDRSPPGRSEAALPERGLTPWTP